MCASRVETAPSFGRLKQWFRGQLRNIAPFLTLLFLVVFFGFASPSFATMDNLGNILSQVSVTGIIAAGLTFVILTAEIDLSVGSVANATGIVAAFFTLQATSVNIANIALPGWAAIVLALGSCLSLGLVNALGITRIGIPSFIMTLAMLQIGNGVCAMLVRGQIAYSVPPLILTLGSKSIGGVPWLVIAAVMIISAMCSGVAGMLGVAYFGSAQQNEFDSYLLDAISAVVVGGTSLFGGRGGMGNTVVGLFVLGVLNNGLDQINIDSFLKILIRGLILLGALIINVYAERLRAPDSTA